MSQAFDLLTSAELAVRLKVTEQTIRLWACSGRIPVRRLGARTNRYLLSDVLAALEATDKKGANA